ncbi:MAG: hypothetical protein IJZ19_07645 [Lentisphaeria bacterium]|nr:hypothetical protein [Lentisphaeria bacterium]
MRFLLGTALIAANLAGGAVVSPDTVKAEHHAVLRAAAENKTPPPSAVTGTAKERAQKLFQPGKIYPVVYGNTISIDGKTSDWDAVAFEDSLKYVINRFAPPAGDADCSVRFKAAMDQKNLYLLVRVLDDKLVGVRPFSYTSDSVEIYFSPSLNNGKKAPCDIQIRINPDPANPGVFHFAGSDNYTRFFMPEIAAVPVAGGWGFEIAIPLQNELFEFTPADRIAAGFSLHYNDNDSTGREHKIAWHPDAAESAWRSNAPLGVLTVVTDQKLPVREYRDFMGKDKPETPNVYKVENNHCGMLNVLQNGDFSKGDTGFSHWGGCSFARYHIKKENGKNYLALDGTKIPAAMERADLLTHCFKIFPGEKYRLTITGRVKGSTPVQFICRTKDENYGLKNVNTFKFAPGDWQRKSIVFKIDDRHNTPERSIVQLMFPMKKISGNVLELANLELVRYVPGNIDATFIFPDRYVWAVAPGEKAAPELTLQNLYDKPTAVSAQFEWYDLVYKKSLKTFKKKYFLKGRECLKTHVDLPTSRKGGFKLVVRLTDEHSKKTLQRELDYAVSEKVKNAPELSAIAIAYPIFLPDDAANTAKAMADCGFKKARFFAQNFRIGPDGTYDFGPTDCFVDALLKKGIETIACIPIHAERSPFPEFDPLRYGEKIRKIAEHFKGRIRYYEIGNECHLHGGWKPESNAKEYSMLLRTAYCTIKSVNPDAVVTNCGFSPLIDAFNQVFLPMNGGNFYDAVAVHPYLLRGQKISAVSVEDGIREFHAWQKNTVVIDTESGADHDPFHVQVEYFSKKYPVEFFLGIVHHCEWGFDRMISGHMVAGYSGVSGSYAAMNFISNFYSGVKNAGEWNIDKRYNVYVTEKDGIKRAAIWREFPGDRSTIAVPVRKGFEVFDAFGNKITHQFPISGNKVILKCPKDFALFIKGVDVDQKDLRLPDYGTPGTKYVPYSKKVLLLPLHSQGFFRCDIQPDTPRVLNCAVKNFSDKSVDVHLKAQGIEAIKVQFSPEKFKLPPGEKKLVNVTVTGKGSGTSELLLSGSADGETMAPLPLEVSLCGEITMLVRGRHVELKNFTDKSASGTLFFSGKTLDVIPYRRKNVTVPAHNRTLLSYEIAPVKLSHNRFDYPSNGKAFSKGAFQAEDKEYQQELLFPIIRITPAQSGAKNWFDSWQNTPVTLSANDGGTPFNARIKGRYHGGKLYLAIRVTDTSHIQQQSLGYIEKGDSVIVGIDPDFNCTLEKGYDDNAFEAGFALTEGGKIEKYRWNGKFGMEGAKFFDQSDARIVRKGNTVDYELAIPFALPPKAAQFGLSIRINNAEKTGMRSLTFGGGLAPDQRSAVDFGTACIH